MRVSVVITNFNYGLYLPASVASAFEQTQRPDEVIVVDDGSTDESIAVLEQLKVEHRDELTVVLQRNRGQAGAINAGFERSTGDVVCMMDADDIWDRGKLMKVAEVHMTEPAAAMVMHRMRRIDVVGNILRLPSSGNRYSGNLANFVVRSGGPWIFEPTSSLSFSRSALERILPIPAEDWRLCADGALAYAAAFVGDVIAIDDVLGSYRIHGTNNHAGANFDANRIQADVEMTNRYLNDFLARIGRPERVNLERNLQYRRDRFYRRGGGPLEALAIAKLITTWPLYTGPLERAKFLARFVGRTLGLRGAKS